MAKVADDYDVIADSFSESRVAVWPEMERIHEFVKAGDRVLDLGCGNGRAYQLFAGKAIEYEGLDVSANLIGHAKNLVTDMLANFRVGSMTQLPYEDGSFDAVLMIASLHHIPSDDYRLQAMREANRVLKPGGVLLMTNWDRWRWKFWREHLRALWDRVTGRLPYDVGDVLIRWQRGGKDVMRYYHAFTLRSVAALCKKAGFAVLDNRTLKTGNIVTLCKKP